MEESKVRLSNGQRWAAQQFIEHYFRHSASGTPTPVAGRPDPVDVDRSWYMSEGPGRFYHPGMFPIINQIVEDRTIPPGSYDFLDFVPNRYAKHPSLTAKLSNYTRDMSAADHHLRALVFGKESALISGQVVVDPGGSKTFKQIEIRPLDTNFDFKRNTYQPILEAARELARRSIDPDNVGISYDIQYRGPGPDHGVGRIYDHFTDTQLGAALRREFAYPGRGPPWLLPSITGQPPLPSVGEHLQYLGQVGSNQPAPWTKFNAPAAPTASPGTQNTHALADWIARLAGVDATDPAKPQRQSTDHHLGLVSGKPMQFWSIQPEIHLPY